MIFKVDDKIAQQFQLIEQEEGLGNGKATFIFLLKYYFLTKQNSLDQSIATLNALLDRMDTSKLPSASEQLEDI